MAAYFGDATGGGPWSRGFPLSWPCIQPIPTAEAPWVTITWTSPSTTGGSPEPAAVAADDGPDWLDGFCEHLGREMAKG